MNNRILKPKDEIDGQPAGQLEEVMKEIGAEFAKATGMMGGARTYNMLKKFLPGPAELCIEMGISPAFYVKAITAFQAQEGPNNTYALWQVAPVYGRKFVEDLLMTTGKRDLQKEFNSQLRMLGTAMSNGIPDYLYLGNPSADFRPWFRILMTAEPNAYIINRWGAEAKKRLELDRELRDFLKLFNADGVKLDLSRIPDYKYE